MITPTLPTCQSIQMLQTADVKELIMILALFNSIPFDYFIRIKMPGLDLTQSVIKQIAVPSSEDYAEIFRLNGRNRTLENHILSYAISILKNEDKLTNLVRMFDGIVYEVEETDTRKKREILDFLFQMAYHLDDKTYKDIMHTFPKYQADHIV